MPSNVTSSLETINELSRLILSQLDVRIENTERENSQQTLPDVSPETVDNGQHTDEQLISLVTERDTLIKQLFKVYTQEQLGTELTLVNKMVSLNNQLTSKSQSNQQSLAVQVLKLRKSKQIKKMYQKY